MDRNDDVFDLGAVTEVTKGLPMGNNDTLGGHREPGLSED